MPANADIWITGLGAHTAAGAGIVALATALERGDSLAAPCGALADRWVARAPDPSIGRLARRLDRSGALFLAAAREAWTSAGLERTTLEPDRIAVIDGSSLGPTSDLLATERRRVGSRHAEPLRPSEIVRMMFGMGGAAFAQEIGARGPVFALSAGSVSGALAVIEGYWKLRTGQVDVVVAGGADAPLDPDVVGVFEAAGILAPADARLPCRPFDALRCGTMLGEGAGVVVLETAARAQLRGARPLAVLLGGGVSGEDGSLAAPDPDGGGVTRAIRAAMHDVRSDRIGWIKAHGTGTRANDAAECRGLEGVLEHVPLTSLKPLLGHCLGASGAVELVAATLAMHREMVPPTLGTAHVDPAFGNRRIALEPEPSHRDGALLLSQSLGGRCAALAVGIAA